MNTAEAINQRQREVVHAVGVQRAVEYFRVIQAYAAEIEQRHVDARWKQLTDAWRKANASWLNSTP